MHDRTNRRNQNTFLIFHHKFFQWFWAVCKVADNRLLLKSFFFSPLCFVIRISWYCFFFSLSRHHWLSPLPLYYSFSILKRVWTFIYLLFYSIQNQCLVDLALRRCYHGSPLPIHILLYIIFDHGVFMPWLLQSSNALPFLSFRRANFFFSFVFFFIHLPFCLFSRRARI